MSVRVSHRGLARWVDEATCLVPHPQVPVSDSSPAHTQGPCAQARPERLLSILTRWEDVESLPNQLWSPLGGLQEAQV